MRITQIIIFIFSFPCELNRLIMIGSQPSRPEIVRTNIFVGDVKLNDFSPF